MSRVSHFTDGDGHAVAGVQTRVNVSSRYVQIHRRPPRPPTRFKPRKTSKLILSTPARGSGRGQCPHGGNMHTQTAAQPRLGAGLGVQLLAPTLLLLFPHPEPLSIAADLALALDPSPSPPPRCGVRPKLRSRRLFAAGVRPSRRGVAPGGSMPLEPRTLRSPYLVRLAAAFNASVRLGVDGAGRGWCAFARSDMLRDALVPSLRPISSRRFVSGILKVGPSNGSFEPSSARGVASNVPQVIRGGRSSGSRSASSGTSE